MVDSDISWYYERGLESDRLTNACQLEEARTRQIIEERLPKRECTIVDIGGAAGAYAFWLASQGHNVHLVDPIKLHIEQAKTESKTSGISLAELAVAEAKCLPFDDQSFDVALLLGPLYHLVTRKSRILALKEAFRVLKDSGTIFAAVISRYGSVTDGFFKNLIVDPEFVQIMKRDIKDGQHRNPKRRPGYFTTAYFHRPEDLEIELKDSGFSDCQLLVIESVLSYIPDFTKKWKNKAFRSLLLGTLKGMESDRTVLGLSGHIMGVAKRKL